jgi:hypothetical protein
VDRGIIDRYEIAISFWPKEIPVADKKLHTNGGATIPVLIAIHDEIEKEMESRGLDDACMQMDWAIYTVVHQLARSCDVVKPHEVDVKRIAEVYKDNDSET